MTVTELESCRVCGSPDLVSILDLGTQALSGRFPSAEGDDPPRAPLELVRCNDTQDPNACGLLQLGHSVAPDELYLHGYGYRSGINRTMREHLRGIVQQVRERVTLAADDVVLDIGSNDGTLLQYYETPGLRRIGIDPAGEQFAHHYPAKTHLVCDYFSAANYASVSPATPAKAITSIAMFYDLETPRRFVADIERILHPDGIWVMEQSYLPAMLRMNAFDTICHEHLGYYALKQIAWMLERHALKILDIEFNESNGGSFRVYIAHRDSPHTANHAAIDQALCTEKRAALDTARPYREFVQRVLGARNELCDFLNAEKAKKKSIHLYGASTKGNVLLQFFGIDYTQIVAAADRNPEKWGHRTPGTRIPIISETEARNAKPDYFLVLPWHFRKEFIAREAGFLSSGGKFVFPLPELELVGAATDTRIG